MAESIYYSQIDDQSEDIDYEGSIEEDTRTMKIDHNRLRKSTSEPPTECKVLIDKLKKCNRKQLLEELMKINTWTFGKCELGHWKEVLAIFDSILEEATDCSAENKWALNCDTFSNCEKKLLLWTLHFTTMLIEHSFSRHTYKSMDRLLALMGSSDMSIVLGVLSLLFMFAKRSNFITRMQCEQRLQLISRLHDLAESWGGKENGFGLADCCNTEKHTPPSGTTLHFEFHNDQTTDSKQNKQNMTYIHVDHIDQIRKTPAEIMKGLLTIYTIPADKEMLLFTHVRLAYHFSNYRNRLLCVQARLQALSVLVYANALQDSAHTLLYNGLLEELVEVIELKLPYLVEIRSAALRTLTAIIHLDRNPHFPKKPGSRLNNIIDVTGASQYHGFLPVLVRNCIASLTRQTSGNKSENEENKSDRTPNDEKSNRTQITSDSEDELFDEKQSNLISDVGINSQISNDSLVKFPLPLATALFSFLYHLASYESGGEALVSCGMMESLLQVINWHGIELEHITFVTRAVRVIDLITNIDMQAFYTHGGLQSFINRLDIEVNLCVKEHCYEFKPVPIEIDAERPGPSDANQEEDAVSYEFHYTNDNVGKTCLPQRAALLKSMLNFLKKALQDPTFTEHIRHLMEGTLPNSLKHIISNAEYYGPSLFLLATDVVTVYVFQEPSLLSTIQDNGLTDVVLQALLVKDVPATREVLASLPNVFSALCLNARGLASFVKCKPFERLFKVLLSPTYLSAMRKRRSSDPLGDAASNLGNAMDELMRHQPSLKVSATAAIIKLLNELCQLGTDPKYICWRPHNKSEMSPTSNTRTSNNTEGSSDEEDDDEEEASTSSQNAHTEAQEAPLSTERAPVALTEYILNVTKFIDAILSNNSTDDHCREFVTQGGLIPLLKILGLPNLPVDCPVTNSAQAVASVCKSILNLAHEAKVLEQGLSQLNEVLQRLKPLYSHLHLAGGSKLLHELANAQHLETAFSTANATPLLHAMGAAHGYVLMFVHVCRTGQNDIRTLSLQHWGSEEGLTVLKGLAELYTSLVWESTLLLALCSDDVIPSDCDFGREDMDKLNVPIPERTDSSTDCTGNVATAMEALTTNPQTSMDVDGETSSTNKPTSQQLKYIKPLLGASSRLGRALAELFGLLVKLCVGSPVRQRRGQNIVPTPTLPSPYARSVATALNLLLANGLNSERLPPSPIPKFRLTFLICSVGFTSPMLFDEKRYPYHLMLQKFYTLNGQATFFKTFKWALSAGGSIPLEEGLEHQNLPEGTGEFLDAWLTLLEKMVNPKAILDSPHVISNKSSSSAFISVAFDPLKYLIQIHKLAFESVMLLWGKKPLPSYGVRMTESILTILRHILRGEKIINDRLNKTEEKPTEGAATSNTSSTSSGRSEIADVNNDNLRQLMDMGFTREHAMEALLHTLNVEQATDYLLSNPPPTRTVPAGMDVEMSEDDQVIQAIVMSLGEPGPSTEAARKKEDTLEDVVPLSETLINNFTYGALPVCLELIEVIPESVFKVCDLLVTIMKRNGKNFRDILLRQFLTEIYDITTMLLKDGTQSENVDFFCESENALKLAYYTHLYTLFFEVPSYFDMRGPCGLAVSRAELLPRLIKLVSLGKKMLTKNKKTKVPKWLTPILLLLDSLGKVSICTQRKRNMHLVTKRIWKWYDVASGKWTTYSPTNNKIINEAYWNGEQTVRITCGRRRYTISFSSMQQINEESNNNRPISMTPVNLVLDKGSEPKADLSDFMETCPALLTEKEEKRCIPIPGFTKEQSEDLVRSCVKLMQTDIDKDALHAIMRLLLRLTQDFDNAKIFVKDGGITCLIHLKESFAFNGFRTLATLLIRHALEGPSTLAYAMEKVIRGRTLLSIPPPYKELMFLLRQIASAVTRDSDAFLEVAKQTLRVDLNSFRRTDDADTKLPMKSEPSTRTQAPVMKEQESIDVICELLNALVQPIEQPIEDTDQEGPKLSQATSSSSRETMCQRASDLLSNSTTSSDILNLDTQDDLRVKLSRTPSENLSEDKPEDGNSRPILAKHCILKILADAVISYAGVARLVTEYVYKTIPGEIITEDCTCLAFLFDKILPMVEGISDRDCSMMCRNLIAGIASCNHAPEAQIALVSEVKAALVRALLMTESTEKHRRLQHITGIILSMIEQCPPVQQIRIFKAQTFNANVNNIARLMLRKGIFNDLARVPHCLDMSSPSFPITINTALKPMECLSKIVNQPITGNITGNVTKKRQRHNMDENGPTHSGTTSTEATNAQGEETVEDTENTEHDISAVASSLDGNPITAEVHEDNVLEEIMERLLERGPNVSNGTMDIDDDTNLAFDHERDATEELMSTDSGDSEEQVDEEENEDDNDVDDNDGDDNEEENDDEEEEDDLDGDDDDNNYDEDYDSATVDRDEDIVMIQYADHDTENEALPRMVRWNENGFAIPIFDESTNASDQTAPSAHPLLVSRHANESSSSSVTRNQRTNRARRYQYLQLNTRNTNPPVILQRLLGPTAQNLHLGSNQMLNSPALRDSARVVVMDNFGLFPSAEEQIDFVDQSGYLFGPSMTATLNHVPIVLHWWREESRFVDGESIHDVVTYVCNKLIPSLIKHRNADFLERKRKFEQQEKSNKNNTKTDQDGDKSDESKDDVSTAANADITENNTQRDQENAEDDEDIDGVPIEDSPEDVPVNIHGPPGSGTNRPQNESPVNVVRPVWSSSVSRDRSEDDQSQSAYGFSVQVTPIASFGMPNFNTISLPAIPDPPSSVTEPEDEANEIQESNDEAQLEQIEETLQSSSNSLFEQMYNNQISLMSNSNILVPLHPLDDTPEYRTSMNTDSTTDSSRNSSENENQQVFQSNTSEQALAAQENIIREGNSASASGNQLGESRTSGNEEIPEGVDPSFLEALPPEMRREVLEQHRMLRLQQRISMAASGDQLVASGSSEVSPEFLAALPPSLQEEVLTQQRLEQQRQAAARANPDEPVDAGAFFETLQPSLRTMILSDMEDSQMSVLPPDLAAEAQTLRRDWEARNRQLVQERFFQSNLTTIIRHSTRGRLASRFNTQTLLPQRPQWNTWSRTDFLPNNPNTNIKIRGRQLLDHESLSCLLVLLFVDDPKLNTSRLHRVIRNLCYHVPTRDWVIKALLSIIERSVHVKPDENLNKPKRLPRPGPLTSKLLTDTKNMGNGANWLNIRMEAALGCHANVFVVNRAQGKRNEKSNPSSITIHPQAAPIICRNSLDLFTSLSRSFPTFLLPLKSKDKSKTPSPSKYKNDCTDFWEMLLKLDAASTKKGKSLAKTHSNLNLSSDTENITLTFDQSAFGLLLGMLKAPVIRTSIQLTDKLLRLLSVISMGMPELSKSADCGHASKNLCQNFESVSAPESALNLAVSVLTYKSCSEEGLEDVTTLLLNLSNCSLDMSYMILKLLLNGAKRIGEIVREQIQSMLDELRNIHKVQRRKALDEPSTSGCKGILSNRFTKESVVITASTKVKTACDLQLPSMAPLTSKSSSQVFFLRVLRVIVQIRDAIKKGLEKDESTSREPLTPLSDQLEDLEDLWNTLSHCLLELEHTPDHHAVLVLQPAVEAFFLVHSPQQEPVVIECLNKSATSETQDTDTSNQSSTSQSVTSDVGSEDKTKAYVCPNHLKFLNFAEKHRTVLNQILRQTTAHLADGPFSVLVDHTRVLDFDIKRRYFRTELERLDQNLRREETAVHIRREHIFEDSFRELYRRSPEEWKNRFYIVFEDEEGQDAGGLLREWYVVISRDIFNPMYALFTVSPGDRVTYMINSASHYNPNHLCYYKFVGRVIAKAIYDNKLLECYFTRSFYKHILGIPVKFTDMESEDYSFYRGLVYLMENNINNLGCDLTFSTEINEFGVTETRDLISNGRNVPVTEENKMEYVRRSCQMKMTGAIRQQLNAFLEGFYDIIPKRLISIFNEQELELLISGLPNVDIEDLKANTEYHKYQANSLQIQWFWRALRSFDQADRAKFLQFVTGTSKVPLQGFGALEGMNGVQKFQIHRDDRSTDRLPSAHTCFNQLDLPVYETYDKLRSYLLKAIHECSEGFGFA